MKYSIAHIAGILDGEFFPGREMRGATEFVIEHLLVDSRRLIFPDTTLFFARRGPGRDGRRFVEDLYKRGVRSFVVHEAPEAERLPEAGSQQMPEANFIVVPDTLAALQRLAAWHRRQYDLPVIGITGSNGKTIVKEWLNQLLEEDFQLARSPKSYNSQTGVPLSVWQLNESHELALFEAGISLPDEMRRLEEIIHPTIGLFTNIGEAHSEGFESLLQKASEKALLFAHADLLIYCRDHDVVSKALAHAAYAGKTHFTWGRNPDATLQIRDVEKKDGFTTIRGLYAGKTAAAREHVFVIPFIDEASIENALHCICVLLHMGFGPEKIARKLENLSPITMRLELKSGVNHCSLINDSYSADLSSLTIALDFLAQQQQHPRRSVILSDILESGREERELYRAVAMALRQKKIDRLVGIGSRIGAHAAEIGEVFAGETAFYPTVDEFKKDLHRLHFRDETILIKGARVFEFEQIDHLLSGQIHQTVLEINLNAMASNLRQYRQLLQPATKVMAMVKAFGYGSGSYEIANLLQFHGVDYLGVAYADEGVALRKAGIRMPIMVMNAEESGFDALVQYNLEPVVYSFHLLQSLDGWLKRQGVLRLPVHIELETGMNRLGFSLARLGELEIALGSAHFTVQSVFSHLAASEEAAQDEFTLLQAALYLDAARSLRSALGYPFLQHIANTAAISRHPQLQLDMVRLGIGLYGVDSAAVDHPLIELQEVSTLRSTIAQIKWLRDGETIGYNRRGIAAAGEVIATVRIGYADGYPRSLGNGAGKMWIRGRLAPVVGSVCMDMTMIDITGIEGVQEGDEVMVFGKQLPVSKLAEWAGTIPYEILTGVSQRVKRVYFEE
ncbi:MAG: bifunctional UDP-N-acetylmuramoyl-tripeptide:D-alanyl-D-alanine ligase/alanine racemase [Bacteroidota bacterium]|nr:bifunctional UDP-N-acetylmuramoyl-tripeptide:D-alanyl-D-alanine ligase/alanine racemase [Bacteroidota bacterium]